MQPIRGQIDGHVPPIQTDEAESFRMQAWREAMRYRMTQDRTERT